jgi:hypothetical protein
MGRSINKNSPSEGQHDPLRRFIWRYRGDVSAVLDRPAQMRQDGWKAYGTLPPLKLAMLAAIRR